MRGIYRESSPLNLVSFWLKKSFGFGCRLPGCRTCTAVKISDGSANPCIVTMYVSFQHISTEFRGILMSFSEEEDKSIHPDQNWSAPFFSAQVATSWLFLGKNTPPLAVPVEWESCTSYILYIPRNQSNLCIKHTNHLHHLCSLLLRNYQNKRNWPYYWMLLTVHHFNYI